MLPQPKILIVGAGFGGLQVAKTLSSANAKILVVDKENHHLFQPLLYQVATAGLAPSEIALPIRHVLKAQSNTSVIMDEIEEIDMKAQQAIGRKRQYGFDYLVLATGAAYNFFGKPEWEANTLSLKSLSDALSIREKILLSFEKAESETDPDKQKELLRFILIGGGPTGVELAGAIAELANRVLAEDFRRIDPSRAEILLIEASERILPSFARELSQQTEKALSKLGVSVRTLSPVTQITPHCVEIGSEKIRSHTIIWSAGVRANLPKFHNELFYDKFGRIKVKPDLSLSEFPQVYVIGDAACVSGEDGKPLPGVAPVAKQQGQYVGEKIGAQIAKTAHTAAFRYRNKGNLATIGRSSAVAEVFRLRFAGFFAWILWLVVHVAYLIGFRNRLFVLLQWAWSYVTFQRGSRLIVRERSDSSSSSGNCSQE